MFALCVDQELISATSCCRITPDADDVFNNLLQVKLLTLMLYIKTFLARYISVRQPLKVSACQSALVRRNMNVVRLKESSD